MSASETRPQPRTRERLLFSLKTRGPQTAAQLARRLHVTATVRQNLQAPRSSRSSAGRFARGVERTEHVLDGARRCAYRIQERRSRG